LTLHQLYSNAHTGAGGRVPFYLQQTLGGVGEVRSFNDQILGSDATKATLRGFRDLRFRGPHLLLLQAEYRLKVAGPVDATLFVDTGTVSARRASLDLSNLARSYGFSLSVMTIDATALRVDVGFGGKEGAHIFFSVGPIFQQ
jgi:outer membrane protein assembly factor BamA